MSIFHNWQDNSSPYLSAENLNELDGYVASGYTYFATCSTAAGTVGKSITGVANFDETKMFSGSKPFVMYVMFANGSSSSTMTLSVNGSAAKNVYYRNSTSNIDDIKIAMGDVVTFVYSGDKFYLMSAISLAVLSVALGGTGRSSLTMNAILAGNQGNAVKQLSTTSGALYAESANGLAKFGTLPIAQGGTGATNAAAARTALDVRKILVGTADPTSDLGSDGDIYLQYE